MEDRLKKLLNYLELNSGGVNYFADFGYKYYPEAKEYRTLTSYLARDEQKTLTFLAKLNSNSEHITSMTPKFTHDTFREITTEDYWRTLMHHLLYDTDGSLGIFDPKSSSRVHREELCADIKRELDTYISPQSKLYKNVTPDSVYNPIYTFWFMELVVIDPTKGSLLLSGGAYD